MYVCYYTYPGTHTPTAAVAPPATPSFTPSPHHTISAAPSPVQIPISEQLLLQAPGPAAPVAPQHIPITISRKRPSEDLMSSSPMITNGTGLSPQQVPTTDNDAKKVKLEQPSQEISRVIHVRGIPENATEAEIVQLGIPFGKVTNVLRVKKSQAFLEMETEDSACGMIKYHSTSNTALIRGKHVFIQFSKHKQLVVDQINSPQNASAKAAILAASEMSNDIPQSDNTRSILRVIVEKLLYPVDVTTLHQIFSRFGFVTKIITFTKNNTFQALIQFQDSISAKTAKYSLDGQNIYNGCCTLKIDFSNLSNLNVKYNNDKSYDYTKVNQLCAGDASVQRHAPGGMLGGVGGVGGVGGMQESLRMVGGLGGIGGMGGAQDLMTQALMPGMGTTPLTAYGAGAAAAMGGTPVYAQMPQLGNYSFANPALTGMAMGGLQCGNSVLLVSNLNEQMATPDALFTLFGVYGDVHRVKILYNKKDNALIQMAEPFQAQQALQYLDKFKVWGKQIRVAASKHSVVQMPREGQPDAGLTKDFTNSPLHRFKRPGSKNCLNIFPPSAVLHLSNIPPNVTEEEITDRFKEQGSVAAFKFFPKDRKMALIQMSSVEEAVEALINLHNVQLSENNHLRVSFSKSTI
ncbi:polypyrimidine tract-binding protein 3-like isoform X2 [Argopecten irradians]|uniref:polypyrimidine tract-binding protein 3-like isoform X2 n=1 Tax=Argopecten irradians TaxID=31199 RepID=UPI0037127DC8